MRFLERVAIVTGGGSGIGLAVAQTLGRQGARLVIADIQSDAIEHAAESVRAAGAPDVWGSRCDVSLEADVAATVDGAIERFGRFDILVNNAGMMVFKALEDLTGEDWIKILQVDLLGAFYFTRQAFKRMVNGGAIVNVASIHAVETEPLVAPYAAAKAALLSLTRSTALEGKPKGIRANAILPGAIDTPMLWENPNVRSGAETIDKVDVGTPGQIADIIAFLCSDEASFIQGAAIRADGGRLDRL